MLKKILLITLSALLISPYVSAKLPLRMPIKEQTEDFTYYKGFYWNKKVERKAMYEAIANGQFHMYDKMMNCQTQIMKLEGWLLAFKDGAEAVADTESYYGMRDMDDNIVRDPEDGTAVSEWLTRDFSEKHYKEYTGRSLEKIKDKFWRYCIAELPVKLFTKEAQDKLEAKKEAEELRDMGYTHDETW